MSDVKTGLNITKGKWHVRHLDGSKWSIDSEDDVTVAQAMQVKPLKDDVKQVERTANAYLIAAAPELLDALERFNGMYVQDLPEDHRDYSIVMIARRAIKKAKGDCNG